MQKKEEEKQVRKLLEELKMVNCPYLGKGKYDIEAMNMLLERIKEINYQDEELQSQDIDEVFEENKSSAHKGAAIQVVTDKNEFLTGF